MLRLQQQQQQQQRVADACFLDAVSTFCSDEAVVLARHVVLGIEPGASTGERVFTERSLADMCGWPGQAVRRVLASWQGVQMASTRAAPPQAVCECVFYFRNSHKRLRKSDARLVASGAFDPTRHTGLGLTIRVHTIERHGRLTRRGSRAASGSRAVSGSQAAARMHWVVDTMGFASSLYSVFRVMDRLRTDAVVRCGCTVPDAGAHFPAQDGDVLMCLKCNKEVMQLYGYSGEFWQLRLYASMECAMGWRSADDVHVWRMPPVPASMLPLRHPTEDGVADEDRGSEGDAHYEEEEKDGVINEDRGSGDADCEEEEEEEEEDEVADKDAHVVMVAGRAKLLCDVTEEDQAVMSEEEHRAFYDLCWASLGADGDGSCEARG